MTVGSVAPALQALARIHPDFREPVSVTPIWNEPKAKVFRLRWGAVSVAAKRCEPYVAELERQVYVDILPSLGLSSLRCYGVVPDDQSDSAWILLEDSGGEMYRSEIDEQRRAAAAWIAAMHIAGCEFLRSRSLTDRTPSGYLGQLRSARANLLSDGDHPLLSAEDRSLLSDTVRKFDSIESQWQRLADGCDVLPFTFVHGDLQPKNLHIAQTAAGPRVLAIDWEHSGWGTPAVDIAYLDLESYVAKVCEAFPFLEWDQSVRLARIGQLFQSIAAIDWATLSLPYDDALTDIRWYSPLIPWNVDEILNCECG